MPLPSRRSEFFAGVRGQVPLLLGVTPFGLAYGAYAVETDLSGALAQSMSWIVFAGASQFVGTQLIAQGVPGVVIVLSAALVNARHMLYSASIAPYVEHLGGGWRWLLAYLLTDEAYAVAMHRYRREDAAPRAHWFFFGTALALWVCWQVSTAAGILVGAAVPAGWQLDFALPLTFLAIVVPLLRDRASLAAATVAGAVALAGYQWPYGTGLFTAAVAGIAAGLIIERSLRDRRRDDVSPDIELA
ncbi:MAG: AzlC family ABC transporter permease [Dehalococcoidia bacterium]